MSRLYPSALRVKVSSIGCELAPAECYDKVELPSDPPPLRGPQIHR